MKMKPKKLFFGINFRKAYLENTGQNLRRK